MKVVEFYFKLKKDIKINLEFKKIKKLKIIIENYKLNKSKEKRK